MHLFADSTRYSWPPHGLAGIQKLRREVSGQRGNVPEHRAENKDILRGGGDERGYGVAVTGELMALRKKKGADEGAGCDLFVQLTQGQLIKMRNGCRE